MRKIIITGIGTNIGKTLIAAIVCEALKADYWKPIQAGTEPCTDSEFIRQHISNSTTVVHPEAVVLNEPMSPHAAAELQHIQLTPDQFKLPNTTNTLVIEPAGGLLVPINNEYLMADLIEQLQAEVIVVSQNYLGSINHTLLTVAELNRRKINICGIVFNGEPNKASEDVILHQTKLKVIGRVYPEKEISTETVSKYALAFNL